MDIFPPAEDPAIMKWTAYERWIHFPPYMKGKEPDYVNLEPYTIQFSNIPMDNSQVHELIKYYLPH